MSLKIMKFALLILGKVMLFSVELVSNIPDDNGNNTKKDTPYVLDKDNNEIVDDGYSYVYNFDNPQDFKRR